MNQVVLVNVSHLDKTLCPSEPIYKQTHCHMNAYVYVSHTYDIYKQTNREMFTHGSGRQTCTLTHTNALIHTCMTYIYIYMHVCMYACMHAYTQASVHFHTHKFTHTNTHTYKHKHTHNTHTHINLFHVQ